MTSLSRYFAFRGIATSYLWEPIFVVFMMSRGLGFADIMWLSLLYSIAIILVEVPTGVFADRHGRVKSMMLGAAVLAVAAVVAACATSVAWFAVAEVLLALSLALCSGADSAYLYDTLAIAGRNAEYPEAESRASSYHMLGTAAALAVGGLLAQWHLVLPYVATAITAVVAVWLAAGLPETARSVAGRDASAPRLTLVRDANHHVFGGTRKTDGIAAHLRGVGADVRDNPRLLWLLGCSAVVFVLVLAGRYLYQPLLIERGLTPVAIGGLLAGVHLLAGLAAWYATTLRQRLSEEMLLWGLLAALALSFALFNQTQGLWVMGLVAVQAIAKGLYSPLIKPMINREIAVSSRRATLLSLESIARRLAMGVFSPIVGYWGARVSTYVCGVIGFVGIALLAVYYWRPSALQAANEVHSNAGGGPAVIADAVSKPIISTKSAG